jgi:hypothetical protein
MMMTKNFIHVTRGPCVPPPAEAAALRARYGIAIDVAPSRRAFALTGVDTSRLAARQFDCLMGVDDVDRARHLRVGASARRAVAAASRAVRS